MAAGRAGARTGRTATRTGTGLLVAACSLLAGTGSPVPAAAAGPTVLARWELGEAAGATRMTDSSGNGLHGSVGAAVQVTGAGHYTWGPVRPNEPPADPGRLVRVDDPRVDPGTRDHAVTFRYRTTRPFGNIMQKGQATTRGGQWKVQLPQGNVTCLYRGALGRRAVRTTGAYHDGRWHTVRCERTSTGVRLTVHDEAMRLQETRSIRGATGELDNAVPMTIGGKLQCDQVTVTCDYFSGDIDHVRIDVGERAPVLARGSVRVHSARPSRDGGAPVIRELVRRLDEHARAREAERAAARESRRLARSSGASPFGHGGDGGASSGGWGGDGGCDGGGGGGGGD